VRKQSSNKLAPPLRRKYKKHKLKYRARGRSFPVGNTFGLEHRFKEGNRANPGGRPSFAEGGKAARAWLAAVVAGDPRKRTGAELFVEILGTLGLSGDRAAIAEMLDRAEGRPAQALTVNEGGDGIKAILDIFQAKSLEVGLPDDDGDLPQLSEGDSADDQA
jgi:Family of unknown function (DUF5681)